MKTVLIIYRYEPDGWWAESPEFPSYTAVGASFEEVSKLAREGLADLADEQLNFEQAVTQLTTGDAPTGGSGFSLEVTEQFQGLPAEMTHAKRTGKVLA
jgi:predicted RNase H-like HicB family nuclease